MTDYPQEGDLVIATITKIHYHSIFCSLDEYENLSGMIHISELAPGRIRNIRDYVSVDRQIVCKVLRLDKEKGHIDLSLRRVNSNKRREKLDELKQELKAEQLVKNLAKKINTKPEVLYKKVSDKAFDDYEYLFQFFREISTDSVKASKYMDAKIADELTTSVKEKFREPKVILNGEISLKTFEANGLDKVKETLTKIETLSPDLTITYLGGGLYKFVIVEKEVKKAEMIIGKVQKILDSFNNKLSTSELTRKRAEVEE